MLLGFVRVVPRDLFLEAAGGFVVVDADHLCADDSLERMEHRAGAQTLFGTGPIRSVAQAHGVVVSVSKSESKQQSSRRLESERVDELLSQQPHGRGAQDHNTLFVQADD